MKLEDVSLPFWVVCNQIKNEKGELFEFKDHYFLYDILRDKSQLQVIKKAAQVGLSVTMNLKTFFFADKMGLSSIYIMPSDSDVEEFAKTKTDRIFQANECIRKRIKLDNVGLKQIGNTFIYYKGTRSKAAPISTTTDILVFDEYDRCDLEIAEIYSSRIVASKFKGKWLLSNPSSVGVGVDLAWKQSDKKEWFITCKKCGESQSLEWETNVDEIRGIYVCRNCGKELTDNERKIGKWQATGQGEWSGYHISQMMAPWLTAKDLIKEKEEKGIEYFRNFILGEQCSVGTSADFRQIITDNWTTDPLDAPPYYMGVDIGKRKHWVLGSRKGIFKIGVCESREELESVITRYNPIVVMDSGPERTWAEEFKRKFPKLFLCFYRRDKDIAEMVQWGGEKGNFEDAKNWGYVWIDRNRVIDDLVYNLMRGEIQFSLSRDDLEKYIKQWEDMRRIEEEVKSLRTGRYIWEAVKGINHFASASWFYFIACKRGNIKTSFLEELKAKPLTVIQTTQGGEQKFADLKEIWEEIHL